MDDPQLVRQVCQTIIPEIYQVNQEDFELDGYSLDCDAQTLVVQVAVYILHAILAALAERAPTAELEDWQRSLDQVIPGKSGLKKVLYDAIKIHFAWRDDRVSEDTFVSRHSKSVMVFRDSLPALAISPASLDKYSPPPSHIAIDMAEIALCEVMQTISVYASDHNLLDRSIDARNLPLLNKEAALTALQEDPDFQFVCKELFQSPLPAPTKTDQERTPLVS
eukprot:Gregarina_sp_Pseudo_9__1780@NODE_220_length_3555_cov_6_980375_g205_i0_p2_GENE_NODE_220_length_3555_cov_6_980375_g205_i0NODE_220_length_3555_cov_6_980375_g205_i0_p2_ORF_typecomplete_len222_score48_55_NODE_220_length_3555_cov_6_980375_g205_i025193184